MLQAEWDKYNGCKTCGHSQVDELCSDCGKPILHPEPRYFQEHEPLGDDYKYICIPCAVKRGLEW